MFKSFLFVIVALCVVVGITYSQNLVIQAGSSFTGSGTYNVRGNIINAEAKSIGGTVNLVGTNQSIGNTGALTFENLNSLGSNSKTQNVVVNVSNSFLVGGTSNFDVNGQTLNLDGPASRTTGTLTADGSGSTVNYRANAGSQSIIDATYTNLNLSNAATKNLQGPVVAGTMTHTGGDLTVDQNLTITNSGTLATISNIAAGRTLTFGSGASTINTLSAVAATASLVNGSGALTINTLSGNSGTITAAANGGAMSFTNPATNAGNITGGAGLVSFASTLDHSTGTVSAGSGGARFDGDLTINSGVVTAGTGSNLDFNANISNAGTISLTGTGTATLAGSFTSQTGTVNLAIGSTWTYDGGNQDVAGGGLGVTYGNLVMAGTANSTKTALGDITVNGGFLNSPTITTNMRTYGLILNGSRTNANALMQFAGLNNGVVFSDGTVEYNGTLGDAASQTIAAGVYQNLLFNNNAPKNILGGTLVRTTANLNINSGVTANVQNTGTLQVDLDLTNAGTLNNDGTVQIGD